MKPELIQHLGRVPDLTGEPSGIVGELLGEASKERTLERQDEARRLQGSEPLLGTRLRHAVQQLEHFPPCSTLDVAEVAVLTRLPKQGEKLAALLPEFGVREPPAREQRGLFPGPLVQQVGLVGLEYFGDPARGLRAHGSYLQQGVNAE